MSTESSSVALRRVRMEEVELAKELHEEWEPDLERI